MGICALTNVAQIRIACIKAIRSYLDNGNKITSDNDVKEILNEVSNQCQKSVTPKNEVKKWFVNTIIKQTNYEDGQNEEHLNKLFDDSYAENLNVDTEENKEQTTDLKKPTQNKIIFGYNRYCSNDALVQKFSRNVRRAIIKATSIRSGSVVQNSQQFNRSIYDYLKQVQDRLNKNIKLLAERNGSANNSIQFNVVNGLQSNEEERQKLNEYLGSLLNSQSLKIDISKYEQIKQDIFNDAFILINTNGIIKDYFNKIITINNNNGVSTYGIGGFYDKQTFTVHDFEDSSKHTNGLLSNYFEGIVLYQLQNSNISYIENVLKESGIDELNDNDIHRIAESLSKNTQQTMTQLDFSQFDSIQPEQQNLIYQHLVNSGLVQMKSNLTTNVVNSFLASIYDKSDDVKILDFLWNMEQNSVVDFIKLLDYVYDNKKSFFVNKGTQDLFDALYFDIKGLFNASSKITKKANNSLDTKQQIPTIVFYVANHFLKNTNVKYNQSTQQSNGSYKNEVLQPSSQNDLSFEIQSGIETNGNRQSCFTSKCTISINEDTVTVSSNDATINIHLGEKGEVEGKNKNTTVFLNEKSTMEDIQRFNSLFVQNNNDLIQLFQQAVHNSITSSTMTNVAVSEPSEYINVIKLLGVSYFNFYMQTKYEYTNKQDNDSSQSTISPFLVNAQNNPTNADNNNKKLLKAYYDDNNWLSKSKASSASDYYDLYNPNNKSIRISKISYVTGGIKALSSALYTENPTLLKSYVKNAEGNNMSTTHIGSLIDRIKVLFYGTKSNPISNKSIFNSSDFKWDIQLQTFVQDSQKTTKNVAKFSTAENSYFMFVNGFLNTGDSYMFLPVTFSDKPSIFNIVVKKNSQILLNGKKISLKDATTAQIQEAHRLTTLDQLSIAAGNTATTMSTVLAEMFGQNEIDKLNWKSLTGIDRYNAVYNFVDSQNITPDDIYRALLRLQAKGVDVTLIKDNAYSEVKTIDGKKVIRSNENFRATLEQYQTKEKFDQFAHLNMKAALMMTQDDAMQTINKNGDNKPEFSKATKQRAFFDPDGNVIPLTDEAKNSFREIFGFDYNSDSEDTSLDIWNRNNVFHLSYKVTYNDQGEISGIYEDELSFDDVTDPHVNVIVNPDFEKFNAIGAFVSTQFLLPTVGLQYIHSYKKSIKQLGGGIIGEMKQTAIATVAMIKRMVIFGGTGHTQLGGLLDGCLNEVNVSVVNDPTINLVTLSGDTHEQDYNDGSVYTNPLYQREYQRSLRELQHEPIASKPITYVSQIQYAGFQEVKTADHALTNMHARKSRSNASDKLRAFSLLRKMWNIDFAVPNINILEYQPQIMKNQYYFDEDNNTIQQIVGVNYLNVTVENGKFTNKYEFTIKNISDNSTKKVTIAINTLFDLYQALGGMNCVEEDKDGGFVFSEKNIDIMFEIENSIRIPRTIEQRDKVLNFIYQATGLDENYKQYLIRTINKNFFNAVQSDNDLIEEIPTQKNVYQPVKEAQISMLIFNSAIKVGPANVNPVNTLTDDSMPFAHFKMKLSNKRTQLNAGHEIEDSHIKEMTQVISALTEMGYSQNDVRLIYQTIGQNIIDELKKYGIETVIDKDSLYDIVIRSIGDSLAAGSYGNISLAQRFVQLAIDEMNDSSGKRVKVQSLKNKVPLSDPQFSGLFNTTIASKISQEVIRRTFPGIAAVLSPSQNMITVYDFTFTYNQNSNTIVNKQTMTYDELLMFWYNESKKDVENQCVEYRTNPNLKDFLASQNKQVNASEVEIGDVISINGKQFIVEGFAGYPSEESNKIGLQYIRSLQGQQVVKLNSEGRNLKNKNIKFTVNINGVDYKFDMWDIDSVKIANNKKFFIKMWNLIVADQNTFDQIDTIGAIKQSFDIRSDEELNWYHDVLLQFRVAYKNIENDYNSFYNKNLRYEFESSTDKEKFLETVCEWYTTRQYAKLKNDKQFRLPASFLISQNQVENSSIYYNAENVEYNAYECMLPNMLQKKLGIKKGVSIGEIKNNKNYFLDFITKNRSTNIASDRYDFRFIDTSGRHLHVIIDNGTADKKINKLKAQAVQNQSYEQSYNGNQHWMVIDGQNAYPISKGMQFYTETTASGEQDFLVVKPDNIESLAEIYFSGYFKAIEHQYSDTNKNDLFAFDNEIGIVEQANANIEDHIQQVKQRESNINENSLRMAHEAHTSFLAYLNVISSRIPAQGMQSFMDMEIAGFIDIDTNVIFVPAMQLFLQGDDYDIDKSYVMTATLSNSGVYQRWSPFFNYDSLETLFASSELPVPNGVTYNKDLHGYRNSLLSYDENILNEYLQSGRDTMTADELIALAHIINDVYENAEEDKLNLSDGIIQLINRHSLYKVKKAQVEAANKNKIWYYMLKSCRNPQNFIPQMSPIEMESIRKVGEKSINGKQVNFVSINNPISMGMMQSSNSIGKDCIGISANGAKITANLLAQQNEIVKHIAKLYQNRKQLFEKKMIREKNYDIVINGQSTKLSSSRVMPGLNWDDIEIQLSGGLETGELFDIMRQVKSQGIPEDLFLTISAFISASTDNAKELILSKINSDQNFMGIYMYAIIMGFDFNKAANFMTQSEITTVMKEATSNFFSIDRQTASIGNAVQAFLTGVSLDNFVGSQYSKSIQEYLFKQIGVNPKEDKMTIEEALGLNFDPSAEAKQDGQYKQEIDDKIKLLRKLVDNLNNDQDNNDFSVYESNERQKKVVTSGDEYSEFEEIDYSDVDGVFDEFVEIDEDPDDIYESGESESIRDRRRKKALTISYLEKQIDILTKTKNFIKNSSGEGNFKIHNSLVNILTLSHLKRDSQCLQIAGTIGSVNQGVPGQLFERAKKLQRINKYVNDVIAKVEKDNDLDLHLEKFDILKFVKMNKADREKYIEAIYMSGEAINVLDVLEYNKHFFNMWNAFSAVSKIEENLSVIAKKTTSLLISLKQSNILQAINKKSEREISKFFFDCIISKFVNSKLRNTEIKLNVSDNFYRYINNTTNSLEKVSGSITLNLTKEEDRRTFVNWMNTEFLANVKTKYSDAKWAQELLPKVRFNQTKLSYNVDMQNKSSILFNEIIGSFNNYIGNSINEANLGIKVAGDGNINTLGDLFALYCIFTYKLGFTSDSIVNMLEKDVDNEKSLINQFFNFEAGLTTDQNNLFNDNDYSYEDLLFRLDLHNLTKPSRNRKIYRHDGYIEYSYTDSYDNTTKVAVVFTTNQVLGLPFKNKTQVQTNSQILDSINSFLQLYAHNIALAQESQNCE